MNRARFPAIEDVTFIPDCDPNWRTPLPREGTLYIFRNGPIKWNDWKFETLLDIHDLANDIGNRAYRMMNAR